MERSKRAGMEEEEDKKPEVGILFGTGNVF